MRGGQPSAGWLSARSRAIKTWRCWVCAEGDDVANVGHSRRIGNGALKTQTESRMGNRSVFSQVAVPTEVLFEAPFPPGVHRGHPGAPLAENLHDLPDSRSQNIHGCNRFLVVVHSHVEGFDILGVVHHHHRASHMLLREPALVFALQVDAPLNREFKFLAALSRALTASV